MLKYPETSLKYDHHNKNRILIAHDVPSGSLGPQGVHRIYKRGLNRLVADR